MAVVVPAIPLLTHAMVYYSTQSYRPWIAVEALGKLFQD